MTGPELAGEFLAATVTEQAHTGGPAEICAVLNRLPRGECILSYSCRR